MNERTNDELPPPPIWFIVIPCRETPRIHTAARSQAGGEGDGRAGEPEVAVDEVANGEGAGLGGAGDDAVPLPLDPPGRAGAGPRVHVLAVVERVEREAAVPLEPAGRVDQRVQLRLQVHRAGVLLPWAAQVGLGGGLGGGEVGRRRHLAPLDGDARVLVGVLPPLRREDVALVRQRLARVQVAALQHHGRVAEHEVDGAVDVAVAEELPQRVHVQSVLVPHEAAPVERRQVRPHAERHRLVLRRPGRVLDRQVAGQEVVAHHSCIPQQTQSSRKHNLILPGLQCIYIFFNISSTLYYLKSMNFCNVFSIQISFFVWKTHISQQNTYFCVCKNIWGNS
jgi:hypothetical protein